MKYVEPARPRHTSPLSLMAFLCRLFRLRPGRLRRAGCRARGRFRRRGSLGRLRGAGGWPAFISKPSPLIGKRSGFTNCLLIEHGLLAALSRKRPKWRKGILLRMRQRYCRVSRSKPAQNPCGRRSGKKIQSPACALPWHDVAVCLHRCRRYAQGGSRDLRTPKNKLRHGGWRKSFGGRGVGGDMGEARINGKPVSLAAAAERAAEILSAARLPVIAGLGTDVAGARASILLAERLRGAYDHMYSARIFADLDVLRQAGLMFTTPSEARLRADVLLFIGKDLTKIWPELMGRLSPAEIPPFDLARAPRKLLWVAPPSGAKAGGLPIETLDTSDLHATLAGLRARVAGRAVNCTKSTL